MLQTFITQSCLKLCSSWQMQGVVGVALNRRRELRVRCTASASHSSAEAATLVLSISPESWIVRVGRANSSTRQLSLAGSESFNPPMCLAFLWEFPGRRTASSLLQRKMHEQITTKRHVSPPEKEVWSKEQQGARIPRPMINHVALQKFTSVPTPQVEESSFSSTSRVRNSPTRQN